MIDMTKLEDLADRKRALQSAISKLEDAVYYAEKPDSVDVGNLEFLRKQLVTVDKNILDYVEKYVH